LPHLCRYYNYSQRADFEKARFCMRHLPRRSPEAALCV